MAACPCRKRVSDCSTSSWRASGAMKRCRPKYWAMPARAAGSAKVTWRWAEFYKIAARPPHPAGEVVEGVEGGARGHGPGVQAVAAQGVEGVFQVRMGLELGNVGQARLLKQIAAVIDGPRLRQPRNGRGVGVARHQAAVPGRRQEGLGLAHRRHFHWRKRPQHVHGGQAGHPGRAHLRHHRAVPVQRYLHNLGPARLPSQALQPDVHAVLRFEVAHQGRQLLGRHVRHHGQFDFFDAHRIGLMGCALRSPARSRRSRSGAKCRHGYRGRAPRSSRPRRVPGPARSCGAWWPTRYS